MTKRFGLLAIVMLMSAAPSRASAEPTTFVFRQQTGVILPAGRCNSWGYQETRKRLVVLLQRLPNIHVDGADVSLALKPLAVIDRGNNEKLLSGGGFSADQVIERRVPAYPLVVARFVGSTVTIEVELEMATTSSLRTDFATARLAFTDQDGCTAKWVGVSVRKSKEMR